MSAVGRPPHPLTRAAREVLDKCQRYGVVIRTEAALSEMMESVPFAAFDLEAAHRRHAMHYLRSELRRRNPKLPDVEMYIPLEGPDGRRHYLPSALATADNLEAHIRDFKKTHVQDSLRRIERQEIIVQTLREESALAGRELTVPECEEPIMSALAGAGLNAA